jgi:hypothetical protein
MSITLKVLRSGKHHSSTTQTAIFLHAPFPSCAMPKKFPQWKNTAREKEICAAKQDTKVRSYLQ